MTSLMSAMVRVDEVQSRGHHEQPPPAARRHSSRSASAAKRRLPMVRRSPERSLAMPAASPASASVSEAQKLAVAAGLVETGDETELDWIVADRENSRNYCVCRLYGKHRGTGAHNNNRPRSGI